MRIVAALLVAAGAARAADVIWSNDLARARVIALEEGRVLVVAYGDNSGG